jgi:glycosyltransferase involved in cell wall biosynthesis
MKKLERVLITYFSKPPILEYLGEAFRRVGVEVKTLRAEENTWFDKYVIHRVNKLAHNLRLLPKDRHFFENHPLAHRNYQSQCLLDAYEEFKPDLVLVIRGPGFRSDVLARTRPLFGWWIEHDGRREVIDELGQYDWFYFINESFVREARNAGHQNVSSLFHAVDPKCFHPVPGTEKTIDVCFVGGWSSRRQQYLEAALSITPNVVIYGGKWAKRCTHLPHVMQCWRGSYVEGEDLNTLYNQSRIVLNVTNWGKDGALHSGMTMRVVEIPATGTFLLSDTSEEMRDMFEPGKHLGVFRDINEFTTQLSYWLQHDSERAAVGTAGLQQVRSHYTYDQMVQKVLDRYHLMAQDPFAPEFPVAGNDKR